MIFDFIVEGKPRGKERPRLGRYGTYTPKKTKEYERLVEEAFTLKYGNIEPIEGAVYANIIAVFEVPKSYSKKRRQEILENENLYTHKPDGDNIAKAILDSLNGLAFKDDSQVVHMKVTKIYGEKSFVHVTIENFLN